MTKTYFDDLQRKIEINFPPKRIISLVPSITELLFDLGLNEEIAGVTKYCIHPAEKVYNLKKVGGTENLDLDVVSSIDPDLIIASKEENSKEEVLGLGENYPVYVTDVKSYDEALNMIIEVGELTGKEEQAQLLVSSIIDLFENYEPKSNSTIAYLIWKDPYMTVSGDTFIGEMIKYAGYRNVFGNWETKYPKITIDDLIELKPAQIFLSSEPFPFAEKHLKELQAQLPKAKIKLVDGEMFSWYGSRMLKAPEYFEKL